MVLCNSHRDRRQQQSLGLLPLKLARLLVMFSFILSTEGNTDALSVRGAAVPSLYDSHARRSARVAADPTIAMSGHAGRRNWRRLPDCGEREIATCVFEIDRWMDNSVCVSCANHVDLHGERVEV